jgi:putative SOS response-associated peptidase YedK
MCFSLEIEKNIDQIVKNRNISSSYNVFENSQEILDSTGSYYKSVDEIKIPESDGRVYPKWWANVIIMENQKEVIKRMRYLLLPGFCQSKKFGKINPYTKKFNENKNTYNARLDKLEERMSWKGLFRRRHGVVPIRSFFEWVTHSGEKRQIRFFPEKNDIIYLACLWDTWFSQDGNMSLNSFAVITDNPNPEVLEMGHDRTPVALSEDVISNWLNMENQDNRNQVYEILNERAKVKYQYNFVY